MAALVFLVPILGLAAWYAWERSHRKTHAMPPGLQPDIDIPHTAEFELYHNAFSLCSKKTRVCLAELDIDHASHHIDLIETGSYKNLSRHFLAVNPQGVVPVLVHHGHPVYESHEQIRYAADHAGTDAEALVPHDHALADFGLVLLLAATVLVAAPYGKSNSRHFWFSSMIFCRSAGRDRQNLPLMMMVPRSDA